ncbi:integrase [Sinorhizobium phage phiM5]|nr:integrase [Sinorhizobium phage phiM5]
MVTATQYIESWLERRLVFKEIRASTASTYRKAIKPFTADLGAMPIDKLTATHLRKFVINLVVTHGASHAHYVCTVLKKAFDSAVKEDVLASSPWAKVDIPRVQKTEVEGVDISTGALQLLWAQAEHAPLDQKLATLLALETGLRRGELAGLRWQDIGPTGAVVVRHTVVIVDRKIILQQPKTFSSRRVVSVTPMLRDILNEARGEAAAFVLGGHDSPLHPETVSRMLGKALQQAGLKNLTAHDFRHAHATHLLRKGVPVSAVARRLGHAKPTTTMSIYAHALREDEDHIVEALDTIFERG